MSEQQEIDALVAELDTIPVDPAPTQEQTLPASEELSVDFWLKFPIRVRPLKFVPGRNRAEKRRFRALAAMEERGTLTTTKPGRGGGTLAQLKQLYFTLARAGVLKQTGHEGAKK